jgi:hypothetical protein
MNKAVPIQFGTTLFHVAALYLGDAAQWYRIAQINNIRDPFLIALTSLRLPAVRAIKD